MEMMVTVPVELLPLVLPPTKVPNLKRHMSCSKEFLTETGIAP